MTSAALADANWHEQAACAGSDTRLWFGANSKTAQETCGGCSVRAECLYDALEHETPHRRYGVWGGLTASQRRDLPALDGQKDVAVAELRELLPTTTSDETNEPERTTEPMETTTAAAPATNKDATEQLPVGKLLAWGDAHLDPEIQDQAARARAALAGLRKRHATDQELTDLTTEAEQLEKRLAELQARKAELAPPKTKSRRRSTPADFDSATVRAWAKANGVECGAVGRPSKAVVEAWRAAGAPSA